MYLLTLIVAITLGALLISPVVNCDKLASSTAGILSTEERSIEADRKLIIQFPHIVYLTCKTRVRTYTCGGSIISPRHILTAAHCVSSWQKDPSACKVYAGSAFRDYFGLEYSVAKVTLHPEYMIYGGTIANDIAVLKLKSPIRHILARVIPMFKSGEDSAPGSYAKTGGWGDIDNKGTSPYMLRTLDMKIVPRHHCTSGWGKICAVARDGNKAKSICDGDSGGPLVIDGRLAGVISAVQGPRGSKKECRTDFPNVFTEVAHYRKWIDRQL